MTQPSPELNADPFGAAPAPPSTGYSAPPPPMAGYPAPAAGGLALPPGTALASSGKRVGAYLLDGVLAVVTLGIGYLIWSLIVWSKGQTPGKQVMKMRVYHVQNRRPASWGQMFVRQVIGGLVNSVTFSIGLLVSVVFLFSDEQHRTIPDRIAGTVVLDDPNGVFATK